MYKKYEGRQLLNGITFSVSPGETICLLGPSGSGKSTLLRIIAGLEAPDSGRIFWDGQNMAQVPVHRRGFGLMFQEYALFPHRSVAENVAFGLRMQGLPQAEIEGRVQDTLRQVNLSGFGRRRVTDLSGGEQQRVALGRAMAPRPRLLMLDEPLGALDRSLREQLLAELRQVLHSSAIPAIYVTHDQEEAFSIADRLILLHEGAIIQQGTPADLYTRPASPWVARFLGMGNLSAGQVVSTHPLVVETDLGAFTPGVVSGSQPDLHDQVQILFRPENTRLSDSDTPNYLEGIVQDVVFQGSFFQVAVLVAKDHVFLFSLPSAPEIGKKIHLAIPTEGILCFDPPQGEF